MKVCVFFKFLLGRFCVLLPEHFSNSPVIFSRVSSFLSDLNCSLRNNVCCSNKSDCKIRKRKSLIAESLMRMSRTPEVGLSNPFLFGFLHP